MKTAFFATLLLFAANQASAKPLAFVKQYGGFCHMQCPSTTLTIHENGQVIVERQTFYPEATTTKTQIASLGKKILAVVKADITKVTAVNLVDGNPDGPMCADIPVKSYQVIKDGKEVEIGAERDCHSFFLESYEATGLVETLKSLNSLYNYSQTPLD